MSPLSEGPEEARQEAAVQRALQLLFETSPATLDRAFASLPASLPSTAATVRDALLYKSSVEALESALVGLATPIDPATSRAAQATENVWRSVEREFGLLSSADVGRLLGAANANRVYAGELRKRGAVLAVKRKNAYVYPGFQFDAEASEVRSWVAPLLRLAKRQHRPDADVVMWMMAPSTYFNGDRPADHVDAPERVVDVAERAWGIEW